MNHNFTYDEMSLLCINLADNRRDAILNLDAELLDIEEKELQEVCLSAIDKLESMTDDDYSHILHNLFPDFDPAEV